MKVLDVQNLLPSAPAAAFPKDLDNLFQRSATRLF
jgi:hypothetical protein